MSQCIIVATGFQMVERELVANLVRLEALFASRTNLSRSTIWKRAVGNQSFLERVVVDGRPFHARTYDVAVSWFSRHWPDGLAWPETVRRSETSVTTGERK